MAAPTPTDLRVAAGALRRTARLLDLTVEPLLARAGPATRRGPAATAFLASADRAVARTGEAAAGLRAVATRLDGAADQLEWAGRRPAPGHG